MKKFVETYSEFVESRTNKFKIQDELVRDVVHFRRVTLSTNSTNHITIFKIEKEPLSISELETIIKDMKKNAKKIFVDSGFEIKFRNKNNLLNKAKEIYDDVKTDIKTINDEFSKLLPKILKYEGMDYTKEQGEELTKMSLKYQKDINPVFIHRTSAYSKYVSIIERFLDIEEEINILIKYPNQAENRKGHSITYSI